MDGPGIDLFSGYDWSWAREQREQRLCVMVDDVDENVILETPPGDFCEKYEKEFKATVPILHEDRITVEGREIKFDVSQDSTRNIQDRNRPHYIPGMIIEVNIPFSGDAGLFRARPKTYLMVPPRGEVVNGKLVIRFSGTDMEPKQLRENIDKRIEEIKQHLDWLRTDVDGFNRQIRQLASERIELRRQRLRAGRELVAALGFPVESPAETLER